MDQTAPRTERMCIFEVGYRSYALPPSDAATLLALLGKAVQVQRPDGTWSGPYWLRTQDDQEIDVLRIATVILTPCPKPQDEPAAAAAAAAEA